MRQWQLTIRQCEPLVDNWPALLDSNTCLMESQDGWHNLVLWMCCRVVLGSSMICALNPSKYKLPVHKYHCWSCSHMVSYIQGGIQLKSEKGMASLFSWISHCSGSSHCWCWYEEKEGRALAPESLLWQEKLHGTQRLVFRCSFRFPLYMYFCMLL